MSKKRAKMYVAEKAAQAIHEVNNLYCEAMADKKSPEWKDLTEVQRQGCIKAAYEVIVNKRSSRWLHGEWMRCRKAEGWTYSKVKDFKRKKSPCLIPYAELPEWQRRKEMFVILLLLWMRRNRFFTIPSKRLQVG